MEDKAGKGFSVKDKRTFSKNGETIKASADSQSDTYPQEGSETAREKQPPPLPEINFASFVISLSSSALFHFGELPDPITNTRQRNLPLAKQTIDILGILKEKTAGNLTEEEAKLLENLLYDLRMRYVAEVEKELQKK
jgi:hypothetical protein